VKLQLLYEKLPKTLSLRSAPLSSVSIKHLLCVPTLPLADQARRILQLLGHTPAFSHHEEVLLPLLLSIRKSPGM